MNFYPFLAEYLAKFSHLIAFHDPELSVHLDGIGFIPDVSVPTYNAYLLKKYNNHLIIYLQANLIQQLPIF